MDKDEYERLKNLAIEKMENLDINITHNFKDKRLNELIQINEIYQAELEAQNDELQTHIIDLETAQNELEILFTHAPSPYLLMTSKGHILRANENAFLMFQSSTLLSSKIPFYTNIHKEYLTAFLNWINNIEKESTSLEILLKTRKGFRYCSLQYFKWVQEDSDTFLLSIIDVHDKKEERDRFKAQNEQLREQEINLKNTKAELEILFSNAPIIYLVVDEKLAIKHYNIKAEECFHFSTVNEENRTFTKYINESYLHDFLNFVNDECLDNFLLKCEVTIEKKRKTIKFKIHKQNYEYQDEHLKILALTNVQKEYDDMQAIQELEEDKRQKETIMLRQNRTAALGEMLQNISHQWRQPLNVISVLIANMEVSLSLEEKVTKEELSDCARDVNTQVKYLAQTITDFTSFFKADNDTEEDIDLKTILENTINLVSSRMKANNIILVLSLKSIPIRANKNHLIQALINIFNNANDVMVSSHKRNKYLFVDIEEDASSVVIKIKDNGGGLDKEHIDKVFDPYFTTKHKSVGTGIGLYMTHQIITKKYKGTISVDNVSYKYKDELQTGAEFTINLPL